MHFLNFTLCKTPKALALVFSWMQGGVCQALHVKITTSVLNHYTCIPLPVWLLWPNSVLLGLTLTVVDSAHQVCVELLCFQYIVLVFPCLQT